MPKLPLLALALTTATSACGATSIPLNTEGALIRPVSQHRVDDCAFVGAISSSQGLNARGYDTNVGLAMNDVRNRAAALGATHVVMNPPERVRRSSLGECMNCVTITANAYDCGPNQSGATRREGYSQ